MMAFGGPTERQSMVSRFLQCGVMMVTRAGWQRLQAEAASRANCGAPALPVRGRQGPVALHLSIAQVGEARQHAPVLLQQSTRMSHPSSVRCSVAHRS